MKRKGGVLNFDPDDGDGWIDLSEAFLECSALLKADVLQLWLGEIQVLYEDALAEAFPDSTPGHVSQRCIHSKKMTKRKPRR